VAEAFSYSDAEREWAREVVARHGQSAGIATDPDGRMIDQPVVDRAHVILRD
jgi:citrate lyase beta subunit